MSELMQAMSVCNLLVWVGISYSVIATKIRLQRGTLHAPEPTLKGMTFRRDKRGVEG